MKLAGLLRQETVENAFVVALLLTASVKQAENAVVESIDCFDTDQICSERIFQKVIYSSLCSKSARLAPDFIDEDSAATLPFELRRVLYLPRELRECFVLRMLIGLPRESCAGLLQVDLAEIRSRLQKAMAEIAGLYASEEDPSHLQAQRRQAVASLRRTCPAVACSAA
jgi:hypothetical protein